MIKLISDNPDIITEYLFNDLGIEWEILTDGEPVSLEGQDITVYAVCGRIRMPMPIVIENNIISFVYAGKDQQHEGVFSLELWINEGEEPQQMVVVRDAFQLITG